MRAHVAVRWATSPVAAVLSSIPQGGHLLEVGCGHGLYGLAALDVKVNRLTGVDPDERKITVARRVSGDVDASFVVGSHGSFQAEEVFDTVLVVDVLYLVARGDQQSWLEAVAARVAPGGTIVIKEMRVDRRAKLAWTRMQELLATRVLHITEAGPDGFSFRSPGQIEAWLDALGFSVESRPVDRRSPWPHHLVVGRRGVPSGGSVGGPADGVAI